MKGFTKIASAISAFVVTLDLALTPDAALGFRVAADSVKDP